MERNCCNGKLLSRVCHNEYAARDIRVRSFDTWPRSLSSLIDPLISNGFFYSGRSDTVICFYCGIRLNDWDKSDDPAIEHAKHKGDCEFLLLIHGNEFVAEVTRVFDRVLNDVSQTPHVPNEKRTNDFVYFSVESWLGKLERLRGYRFIATSVLVLLLLVIVVHYNVDRLSNTVHGGHYRQQHRGQTIESVQRRKEPNNQLAQRGFRLSCL